MKSVGYLEYPIYSSEQQVRLRLDEFGRHLSQNALLNLGSIGPEWTWGNMEKPAGEKDMGGWIAAVYTEEQ